MTMYSRTLPSWTPCQPLERSRRPGAALRMVLFAVWIVVVGGVGLGGVGIGVALAQTDTRVALVIGNGAYKQVPALPNPPQDAKAMAQTLEGLGFKVVLGQDLTLDETVRKLRDFSKLAEGADVALVFYAGHGLQVAGRNFLLPVDARIEDEMDLRRQAVDLDEIMGAARPARRLRLVILDACRDNPFLTKLARSLGTRGTSLSRGFARVDEVEGNTLVAYATRADAVAEDGKGQHSPYTAALLETLQEPPLPVERLFGKVRDKVMAATNGRQQPFVYGSLGGEEITLAAETAHRALPGGPAAAAPVSAGPQVTTVISDREAVFWQSIKDSHRPADFEAYLRKYPEGDFAELARNRLREVAASSGPATPATPARTTAVSPAASPTHSAGIRDCATCPELVVIPAGRFEMGAPDDESGHDADETPRHGVTIPAPLAVGRYEVTFAEWDACVAAGACAGYKPADEGWGRERQPVIQVSWEEARAYTQWLTQSTGKAYRLLSEAEWEYAARGGTPTATPAGPALTADQANFDDSIQGRAYPQRAVAVGHYPPNPFGLHDLLGNVWEWVEDCYHEGYRGAPSDGSAWISAGCPLRVLRGGAWNLYPTLIRSAARYWDAPERRANTIGFRVVRPASP